MTIQMNTHSMHTHKPISNAPHDTARGPQKTEEHPLPQKTRLPEDKTTFSAQALSPATSSQPLSSFEEDTVMAGLQSLPRPENLATAHNPISYERVMQLLE